MVKYVISRVQAPEWEKIPAAELRHTGWLPPSGVSAKAQACHDGGTLYLRMEAVEANIRATLRDPLDMVCNDSCLEFFFAPSVNDRRYFNFECNPLGTLYLGFGAERETRVRQIVPDPGIFHIAPFFTEAGWGVSMSIPLAFLQLYVPDFTFSGPAAANFYKCGDLTETPHYLAWSPLSCSQPDYHRRAEFGQIIFA